MQDNRNSNGNDVQFNLHIAGGWTGKKTVADSLKHFSQLKIHRSFDYGNEPFETEAKQPIKKNTDAEKHSEDISPHQNQQTGIIDIFAVPDDMNQMLHRSLDSQGNPKLILYKYRWIVLLCFGMAQASVGMASGTCATTASIVKEVYHLSLFQANLTNLCYFIMYVPGNFMSIAVLNRYGMKATIVTGTVFILIGSWIRCFIIFTDFLPFYIGSFITALGQPFLMNLPSKVASNWFGDKERAMASSLGALSVFIGAMVSFTLPQFIFGPDDTKDPALGRRHFCMFLMIQTLLISIFTIPALSFIKQEPPSPPSIVANDTNNDMGFSQGMKELVKNKNYILMFVIYLLVYGIHASMGAVYANLAAYYDYNVQQISMSVMMFMIGGIISSIILGAMLDKYQCYKKIVQLICFASIFTNALQIFSLSYKNVAVEYLTMFIIGATVVPITPVAFAFTVELTFPVPEALTNGIMITCGLLWGTAEGLLCSALQQSSPKYPLVFWVASTTVALGLTFFVEEDLRRLQLDDVKNSEYIQDDEVRRQSFEQREVFLKEVGLENDLKFHFEFDKGKMQKEAQKQNINGTTFNLSGVSNERLNRSHDQIFRKNKDDLE